MLGHAHANPAILAFDPESAALQIGQKTATRFVIRVRNMVAQLRFLACDVTYTCHGAAPIIRKRRDSTLIFGVSQAQFGRVNTRNQELSFASADKGAEFSPPRKAALYSFKWLQAARFSPVWPLRFSPPWPT